MGKIWIAGKGFDIETNVVRWDEGPRLDAHSDYCISPSKPCRAGKFPYSEKKPVNRTNRYSLRPALRSSGKTPPLGAVQSVVKQFILHHDGCPSAKTCFNVLHNERGLSCHFLLDNDGTIYQTLDIAYMGYHAAGFNANSVGIELCNRGDANDWPNYYAKSDPNRVKATCRIHGHPYLAWDYTKPQYEAMIALTRGLSRALPNMPIEYPQESPGRQSWTVIGHAHQFAGMMGHYHTTKRKWDPGPFDFQKFVESIRGQLAFPISIKGDDPFVPDDDVALKEGIDKLYQANEERGDSGFFPVGPNGEHRLWHGGVHLPGKRGQGVYLPFAGRVVAARVGAPMSSVGHVNFVLVRHDMAVGVQQVRFWSLYFHLDDEWGNEGKEGAPEWMAGESWKNNKARGRTVLLDEPLKGSQQIGRMGVGGPDYIRRPQVHFQIFATEDVGGKIQKNLFTFIDGITGGRFVNDKSILAAVDSDKDGQLSRREILSFFSSNSDRKIARFYVTRNVSEWIGTPDWADELALSPEFKDMGKDKLRELVDDQIKPTLWWTDKVARHAKLPRDGVVYHYNPITFVKFINEKLREARVLGDNGKNSVKQEETKAKPKDIIDDIDDVDGETFVTDAELVAKADYGQDLTLEDLAAGFPE